jgi:sugar lactone lactonase YvrE
MGDARRYVAGALATVASISVSITLLAAPAGAQTAGPTAASQTAPIISTAAGTGQAGYSGDNGSATAAKINNPTGVSEDTIGNLYIGDTSNDRVRKVSTGGVITTLAGNGMGGFSGDGGQAKNARLCAPSGTAVDGSGNVFIADSANNRVRKVAPGGVITTYAGSGNNNCGGNNGGGCQRSGDNGLATKATLCLPTGLALDSAGNLYIADSGNNVVRKVTPGGVITTFAGTGAWGSSGDGGPATSAKFAIPTGLAVDNSLHRVYIADTGNSKVRAVNSGVISTFAGTGSAGYSGDGNKAVLAKLSYPTGLGVDPLGNVYVSDTGNHRVRCVIPKGDIVTYAGTGTAGFSGDGGPATQAMIHSPTGAVATDGQNVYFSDTGNNRVRKVVGGPPPNIPEIPLNLALLPLSALAVMAGGYVFFRRRRLAGTITA